MIATIVLLEASAAFGGQAEFCAEYLESEIAYVNASSDWEDLQ